MPALRRLDRLLAGSMTGMLYLTGALSAVTLLALPGTPVRYPGIVLGVAALGALWGLAALTVVRWNTAAPWLTHVSSCAGFAVAGVIVAATGGATSPARFFLFFIAVYAAYFYTPRQAAAYLAGCALAHSVPLFYDSGAVQDGLLRELVVVIPSYFVLGGAIAAGTVRLREMRDRAERVGERQSQLAAEQQALRHVATAVAEEETAEAVYALVSEELAQLVGAQAAGIVRYDGPAESVVVGAWSDVPADTSHYVPGTVVPLRPGSDLEQARLTRLPVRIDHHPPGSPVEQMGFGCSIVAPVLVNDQAWGVLAIVRSEPASFASDTESRLIAFAELLAMAIVNTEHRSKLAAQASTDPLTGMANHRAFHERLAAEVSRARRHDRELSLALIDVDHFKQVNDSDGHAIGDQVLAEVAACLREDVRAEDVVARIGGDEFAVLMPETRREQALALAERARRRVGQLSVSGHRLTVSIGICDLSHAGDGDSLVRLADGALYWAKAHGRDGSWLYDPEVVRELSAQERAEHLQNRQAITALRALAHAIDAKDPTTRLHAERVAALAAHLAGALGWTPARRTLLSEAALIHDVGKIGVPDAILVKPGPLGDDEFEVVKQHAALGAQIAKEVLLEEQVDWIRWHHERADGRGYPDGRLAAEIPEGAALLAIADAFDVMTVSRPYGPPMSVTEAVEECRSLAGLQFTERAVEALCALPADVLGPGVALPA